MGRFHAVCAKPETVLFFLFFLAVTPWTFPAGAHELRPAIATMEFTESGEVELNISLNLEAAIAGIGADHKDTSESPAVLQYDQLRLMPPTMLRAEFDNFEMDFLDRISLETGEGPIQLRIVTLEVPEVGDTALPRISRLGLKGAVRAGIDRLFWRADPRLGNSVIRLRDPAADKILGAEYVVAGEISAPLSVGGLQRLSWSSVLMRYVEVGFTHIVPKGLDHILFVIGLFLLSTCLSVLLWQVTAFTVAHTLTLALGMAGIVQLPPAIVEPLIAASIIYVAIENILTDQINRWRLAVVFCFGLLHGLGFASVLQDIGAAPGQFIWSLLAFNVGVELGQLAVISACFIAVGWMMKQTWYRSRVIIPASLAIGIIAGFWVVERTGLA